MPADAGDSGARAESRTDSHSDRHWEIFVVEYARAAETPLFTVLLDMGATGHIEAPFAFVVARRGGRVVLVDCGFMRDSVRANMGPEADVTEWISPLRMLEALGVTADAVTEILVSHAHFDHMGGIGQFPNARIYIQKRELLSTHEAMALPPEFGFLTVAVNPDDLRAAFDAAVAHRLTLLDGDRDDVVPGIHVRFGPGHTPGQQYVAIETAQGRRVVSGDCVYAARNLTGMKGDGVYVPLGFGSGSIWDQLTTMDRIKREVGGDISKVIILHDDTRWAHLPVVAEVEGFRIFRAA